MWKKERSPPFATPTVAASHSPHRSLSPTTNLETRDFAVNRKPVSSRRATGDLQKGLPDLPSESLGVSDARGTRPVSTVPTASSIYSQPSPEVDNNMGSPSVTAPRSSSIYPDDVSPPDSPVADGHDFGHSRKSSYNVSPISSENPSPFTNRSTPSKTNRYSSNLPVPKKNLKKFWKLPDKGIGATDQESSTVRWDEYSGEPTDSARGKPPSTTPGAVRLNEDPTPGRLNYHNFGTSTHISGGNAIPRKRVGNRDISDTSIVMRPEWKGAGGRHKIVPPPPDKPLPQGQSPKFPPGLSKKQQLEDEERMRMERAERERLERERVEQERIEEERREKQRLIEEEEEERIQAQRREQERAEQLRLEKERAEQDRRIRERVAQARRERDLAAQAQKREQAALKAEAEKEQAAQKLRQESSQSNSVGASTHTTTSTQQERSLPSPIRPDAKEQRYGMTFSQKNDSPDSASFSTSSTNPTYNNWDNDDHRSPLARNPSDEEIKDGRKLPSPSSDVKPSSSHSKPQTPEAQTYGWQPRTTSLAKNSPETPDTSFIESRFRAEIQNMSISNEPKSRVSTTTYATTAYNDSPPSTPGLGSDSPTLSASNTPNSILNRKRPIPPAGISNARATARKPTPSEVPPTPPLPTSAPDPNRLNSKSLPKAPPDVPKVPTVQTLQAKQDALRRRKRNIETVIHELTEVVQPSSIAYDMASRQEIKKTVEQLKKELAEVIKDEHETGLKLHRAWKRQDGFAAYEPTSIWVRRVTT